MSWYTAYYTAVHMFCVQAIRNQHAWYAGGIYYPKVPGVRNAEAHTALRVVNATDSIKKFASSSKDSGSVLAQLLTDLGSSRLGFFNAALSALLLGAAFGAELAGWLPLDAEAEHQGDGRREASSSRRRLQRRSAGSHTQMPPPQRRAVAAGSR